MYWDVVEVKPEPEYRLFVRFKDGLSGRVQLAREELTGVLAPLADVDFFERVFIDQGAVTWPGEIDLAPEAMHADITARNSQRLGMRFSPESPDVAGYRTGGSPPDPPAGTDAF